MGNFIFYCRNVVLILCNEIPKNINRCFSPILRLMTDQCSLLKSLGVFFTDTVYHHKFIGNKKDNCYVAF